LQIEVAAQKRT